MSKDAKAKQPKYKRSFWGLHKWKIILGAIAAMFFAMFSSVLIFYAKIFEEYRETPILQTNYSEQYHTYEVDGILFKAHYRLGGINGEDKNTTLHEKTIWYSVKNPEKYIFGRRACIIGFSIADGVILIMAAGEIAKYNINKQKARQHIN